MLLKQNEISKINMGGKGGAERHFSPILPDYRRVSAPLYDFINETNNHKIELKKQKNLQWFDAGKYHNLSTENKNICMLFVLHNGEDVVGVYSITLGKLIDLLCKDSECQKDGWTVENIKQCYQLKISFPKMQVKVPVKVKNFIKKYKNDFGTEYESR